MTLNEYQKKAMTTCMGTCDNFSYMMLNLVGEVGEFAGKIAKQIRKENVEVIDNDLFVNNRNWMGPELDADFRPEFKAELRKEAGDMLWQLSGLCHVMGWDLEDVAVQNLEKLASRKERGVIDGCGDNR
jgi:NTP pyrophosphatase (non-canonical NTP hydrolase)